MGKANFSDEFKRDAVAQITERGYRVTEERDILKKATAYLTFGHFVPPGMQSEIRVRCRASHAVPGARDVPVSAHPAQRLLRLVEEPVEQTREGRCSADRSAPAGMGRQRQGLWLSQAA
ncbi:hypothetical protein GCM10010989_26940 [Croceicoccus pelagius]|uniref:Transposase n=1 Tax=Croceicoccus pelagius TaxID=1703341 RepID=A0A916YNE3_9SPHN|nr:hypothetical protein GCM10010989_26940 [Croceicoccus pelagius]